jgi:hypothetical protein
VSDSTHQPPLADGTAPPIDLPIATVARRSGLSRWFASRFWFLTAVCGLMSAGLFWYARSNTGDLISIEFQHGHGIKLEDRLTFRGIDIGSVEKIELHPNREAIVTHVRMLPQTRHLAAEGAKFWIVRPRVSLESIQGLETLVGAKYIAIEPSSTGVALQSHFVGLEAPPMVAPPEGSLEISLDGTTRGGIESGAPILYRGFRIGNVVHVGLASDARTVRARCAIDPEYRDLVRQNSRFWNRSGWSLEIGITGVRLDADTLAQILSGGIEMATPTDPAPNVNTGQRFVLHDNPDPDWLTWKPSLAHGKIWSNLESRMPQPIRTAVRWQERSFGFRRNHQRSAWCLPLSDGSFVCLSEQVVAPKSALANTAKIELGGISVSPEQLRLMGAVPPNEDAMTVVRFQVAESIANDIARWPADQVANRFPEEICDVLIPHADASRVVAVDAARIKSTADGWVIDDSVVLDADAHGLPVVSTQTSQVIGLLIVRNQHRIIINHQ